MFYGLFSIDWAQVWNKSCLEGKVFWAAIGATVALLMLGTGYFGNVTKYDLPVTSLWLVCYKLAGVTFVCGVVCVGLLIRKTRREEQKVLRARIRQLCG